MSISSIFTSIAKGVHRIVVGGEHVAEKIKLEIDARPGLKADLDKLLHPAIDFVRSALDQERGRLLAGGVQDVAPELKKAVPSILNGAVKEIEGQVTHGGNAFLIADLAYQAVSLALGL